MINNMVIKLSNTLAFGDWNKCKSPSIFWLFLVSMLLIVSDYRRLVAAKSIISEIDDLVTDYSGHANAQNLAAGSSDEQFDEDSKVKGLIDDYLESSPTKHVRKTQNLADGIFDENEWSDDMDGRGGSKSSLSSPSELKVSPRSSNINAPKNLNQPHHHALVKKFFRFPENTNKRAWDIKTYYDIFVQNDGSILFIPKDVNKNHYFIG